MDIIPREIVLYNILTSQPLEDLYTAALVDASFVPILREETLERIGTVEPLEVALSHNDLKMLQFLVNRSRDNIVFNLPKLYNPEQDVGNNYLVRDYVQQNLPEIYLEVLTRLREEIPNYHYDEKLSKFKAIAERGRNVNTSQVLNQLHNLQLFQ